MLASRTMVGSNRSMIGACGRVALGLAAVCLVQIDPAAAAGGTALFDGDTPIPMVLEGPWKSILRDREDRPVEAGRLVLGESTGTGTALDVKIRVRGRWRLEHCSRPPLTLRFEDDQIAATPFAGQAVVHLTPQCRWGEKFEQHLVQEYLIYRAYRLLTDVSLRTRLAAVELRDPDSRRKPWSGYMILVEDIGLAAGRLGLEWSEVGSVGPRRLDPDTAALFALFQFMIGHTDWSIIKGPEKERCCHNAALLAPTAANDGFLPVPYDFDASGLVDTGEIDPSSKLPIRTVRQRLYRGFCVHNPRVPIAVERLRRARSDLTGLIEDAELLSPKYRRSSGRFLEDFYEIVEDPEMLESRILDRCRE